jgi:Tfp pilus assembly protein PilV
MRLPHRQRNQRGQSLVELALVAPVLFLMAIGVADVGRAFYYREAVANANRQAARLMAQDQEAQNAACAGSSATPTVTRSFPDFGLEDGVTKVINAAALEASSDGTRGGSVLNQPSAATTIKFTFHCKLTPPVGAYTNQRALSLEPEKPDSDAVLVELDYTFKVMTPLVGNLFSNQVIHIQAKNYQRNEF